eukprot:SM000089S23844  [mRNA]  locus=s89:322657:326938:- [translate_table: standard]
MAACSQGLLLVELPAARGSSCALHGRSVFWHSASLFLSLVQPLRPGPALRLLHIAMSVEVLQRTDGFNTAIGASLGGGGSLCCLDVQVVAAQRVAATPRQPGLGRLCSGGRNAWSRRLWADIGSSSRSHQSAASAMADSRVVAPHAERGPARDELVARRDGSDGNTAADTTFLERGSEAGPTQAPLAQSSHSPKAAPKGSGVGGEATKEAPSREENSGSDEAAVKSAGLQPRSADRALSVQVADVLAETEALWKAVTASAPPSLPGPGANDGGYQLAGASAHALSTKPFGSVDAEKRAIAERVAETRATAAAVAKALQDLEQRRKGGKAAAPGPSPRGPASRSEATASPLPQTPKPGSKAQSAALPLSSESDSPLSQGGLPAETPSKAAPAVVSQKRQEGIGAGPSATPNLASPAGGRVPPSAAKSLAPGRSRRPMPKRQHQAVVKINSPATAAAPAVPEGVAGPPEPLPVAGKPSTGAKEAAVPGAIGSPPASGEAVKSSRDDGQLSGSPEDTAFQRQPPPQLAQTPLPPSPGWEQQEKKLAEILAKEAAMLPTSPPAIPGQKVDAFAGLVQLSGSARADPDVKGRFGTAWDGWAVPVKGSDRHKKEVPLSSDLSEMNALRTRMMTKLSEANQYNRHLSRELQQRDTIVKQARQELAGIEAELQALVSISNEIADLGMTAGTRKINGRYIQSYLAISLADVHRRLRVELQNVDSMSVREVPLTWCGMAEDVKVMGSFDGWTHGEQMSPESTGAYTKFTSTLRLRPGRYEIKFLVDGEWRIANEWPTTGEGLCVNNVLTVQ